MKLEQIYTYGSYLKNKFGTKVYKVPISISGFTCPNIDGSVAVGGCTFCENDSFSPSLDKVKPLKGSFLNLESKENPFLENQLEQLKVQFDAMSERLRRDYGAEKFLVYFQSFTNTYAPLSTLKELYGTALSFDDVIGLSIGTRSDSVTQETLEYLVELSKTKEIWIEFGIQTVYDETLERINRGHDAANVEIWIKKSKDMGLNVCGHLIYGLPGENKEMMLNSSKIAYEWGIDSVKYHPLYVVKRTALANEHARGEFTPITEEDYIDVLVEALKMKPKAINVQRMTAGISDDSLIAPLWCRDKNAQLRHINAKLKLEGLKY